MERSLFRTVEPTEGFSERILQTVETKHEAWRRRERVLFGVSAMALLLALAYSILSAAHAFALSNFGDYASLVFSDGHAILAQWRALLLGMFETLPAGAIMIVSGALCAFLWAARRFSRPSRHPVRYRVSQT